MAGQPVVGKRALVVHNLGMLERRFPKHREECAAFIVADPLQTARQTIECAAAATPSHPRLLITGTGVIGAVTRERARAIASETEPVVILQIRHCTDGAMVTITNAEGGMPQSLQFNLASSNGHGALVDFLQSQRPSGIEILDPANVPQQLVELLLTLKVPYDIFIADAGLLGPRDAQPIAIAALESPAGNGQRVPSAKTGAEVGKEEETNWVKRWRTIADGARRILVPCPQAEAFAASILPQHAIEAIARPAEKRGRNPRRVRELDSRHLAFVPVRSCAHEQRLMSAVTRKFIALQPDLSFTIIGTTLDDMGLMRGGNAFVTGAVAAEDFEHLIAALGVRHLFVSMTRPLFGHPTLNAVHSSSLATAYFDWSMGRIKPKKQDLAIDPRSSLDHIIDALSRWMLKP